MMTPNPAQQAVQLAQKHFAAGRWTEAWEMYRQALLADPNSAVAMHGMSLVSVRLGRMDMAFQWADRAVKIDPSVADYHFALGDALRRAGLLAQAIGPLEKSLQLKPGDPTARRALDETLAEKRQLDSIPLPGPTGPRRYVVVTGYFNSGDALTEDFFRIWHDNTTRFAKPARIFVINAASKPLDYGNSTWINLSENLFHHAFNLPPGQQLGGFSASVMIGCLLAYHERADMLFKEQDCLAFGNYVETLYAEMGDKGMVAGPILTSGPGAGLLAVSLMLIRHEYLLEFVARYLSLWPTDREFLPEHKLMEIAKTGRIVESKMGFDRNRPINFDAPAFHLQKMTVKEMEILKARGLV